MTDKTKTLSSPVRKAIGYCRVSSETQEENTSLDDQEHKIRAFAESQSIDIVAMFHDVASGASLDRQGYRQALKYIEYHKVHCFIVAKFDRAHRHQEHLLVFERELREKEIAFLSVAELLDSTSPTGRLMFQILGSFAEFEKNQINERTRNGRRAKLSKNEYTGGRIPLGYDRFWKVSVEEAQMVRDIFRQYLTRASLSKVSKYCDRQKYRGGNGKKLSKQALALILKNRAYLGEYRNDGKKEHNNVVVKWHHEPIVAFSTFGRVQKMLMRNCKNPRN